MTQAIERVDPAQQQIVQAGPDLSVDELVIRVEKVREVHARVMVDGKHYGKIPGVKKPSLLKPGAELLGMVFRLDPQFEIVEQLRDGQHLTVVVRCVLYHAPSGIRLGSGMGSCSTRESKYAWRNGERLCPSCGKPAIIKGKEEYGGGWLCFKKKDGCGAKFKIGDAAIEGQQVGRVPNEDLPDAHNTVLKMAIKRAHVAAILFVTCASEIFTQDVEDMGPMAAEGREAEPEQSAEPSLTDELLKRLSGCATVAELETVRGELTAAKAKLPKAQLGVLARAFEAKAQELADKPQEPPPESGPAEAPEAAAEPEPAKPKRRKPQGRVEDEERAAIENEPPAPDQAVA